MSRFSDLGISVLLAIAFVTIAVGFGIPLVAAAGPMIDDDVAYAPGMEVYVWVACEYLGPPFNCFITTTYESHGYTYVPWPNVLLDWDHDGKPGSHYCWAEQYGKNSAWPYGYIYERWALAEIWHGP